jgi:uncharacterized LabA/DUF88 family protein
MMTNVQQKVYAFIDSQNLNLSVANDITNKKTGEVYKGWKLDFERFNVYLKDKYKVSKSILFIGKIDGNEALYASLERFGYHLIFKPTLEHKNGKETIIKGNIDAELVLHAMIELPNYDKAIIVSGDGDYHCLVEYLEQQNKLLHVFIPNRHSYSSLLREFRSYFVYVSDLRGKLEKLENKKRE